MRYPTRLLVTALTLWTLGVPIGFAQDQELERLLADPAANSGSSGGAAATEPERSTTAVSAEGSGPEVAAAPRRRVIEEIVVTAERKEERLRDVPIAMSALDSEFLAQENIVDFRDVGRYVPNLRFEGGIQRIGPNIRGIGTPADVRQPRSFEQAVGLLVDGVPYSRSEYFQAGLLDLDRLEVLRGPQGTLMGKNASVGSLNLSTKDPTDEYTGQVSVQLGELDRRRFEAGIGGPLLPTFLNFRIAGLSDEQDGFIQNTTARVDPSSRRRNGARESEAIRTKLEVPDLLGANLRVSYERFDTNFFGKNLEPRRISDNVRGFFLRYDPNSDFEPDNFVGTIDTKTPVRIDIDTFAAHASYELFGWGLETHAGWTSLEFFSIGDADNTPAPVINGTFVEQTRQVSAEALLHSPELSGFFGLGTFLGLPLGWTDFTTGVLYQRQRIDPIRGIARVSPALAAELVSFDRTGSAPPSVPGAGAGEEITPTTEWWDGQFDQTTNVIAGFGQGNWQLRDAWTLLFGVRAQFESKDARWNNRLSEEHALFTSAGFEEIDATRDRSDVAIAPKVGLKYRWTDDYQFFATWSRGFRAGGFNSQPANAENPEQLEFEPESVEAWELGAKTELLDGIARLDLTLYTMDLTDFQLDTNLPAGIFNVPAIQNAGEVRARGFEADATWLATDWLTLRGALAFNETELIEFPFGPCEADRENFDGDEEPRCDLSGGPLPNAPKWAVTLTPQVTYPLSSLPGLGGVSPPLLDGIELRGGVSVEWQDTHFLRLTLDPRTRQDSFFQLDANFGLTNLGRGWDLTLAVDNLTNESVSAFADDVNAAEDAFVQFPGPPRLVFGSFRWRF